MLRERLRAVHSGSFNSLSKPSSCSKSDNVRYLFSLFHWSLAMGFADDFGAFFSTGPTVGEYMAWALHTLCGQLVMTWC